MYIPNQLWFGFILSKSKWLEIGVNDVSENWQWKGQKGELYTLHLSSIWEAMHVNQVLFDFGNDHANFKKAMASQYNKDYL